MSSMALIFRTILSHFFQSFAIISIILFFHSHYLCQTLAPHSMLTRLPVEIQTRVLRLVPGLALKHTCLHFYVLYNNLFYEKIVRDFGDDIVGVLTRILPWLTTYIRTLDAFRRPSRLVLARRLKLAVSGGLQIQYVADSWKYVHLVLRNKRLFAEYDDYKIDEPNNYAFNNYVEINRSYLLSYTKTFWLAPGAYNLNIGLVVKHGSGLGTTKFEVKYENDDGDTVIQTFYPPTNINDILPKKQFCFLRLGEFKVPENIDASFSADDDEPYGLGAPDNSSLLSSGGSHSSNLNSMSSYGNLNSMSSHGNLNSFSSNQNLNNFSMNGGHNRSRSGSVNAGVSRSGSLNAGQAVSRRGSAININSTSRRGSIINISNSTNSNSNLSSYINPTLSSNTLASLAHAHSQPQAHHTTLNSLMSVASPNNTLLSPLAAGTFDIAEEHSDSEDDEPGDPTDPLTHAPSSRSSNKLYKVQLVMEEIGLYVKSGFRIFFIDISQPLLLFNDYDLLYYSVKETDYRLFINIPLKNLYKVLNHVQNGGSLDELDLERDIASYGQGDPKDIADQLDESYLDEYSPNRAENELESTAKEILKNSDSISNMIYTDRNVSDFLNTRRDPLGVNSGDNLLTYADFFYNNRFKKRYFKFNTIYQRRQFINRFGDFELDWDEYHEGEEKNGKKRSCVYDKAGLKWKIPIVGEL